MALTNTFLIEADIKRKNHIGKPVVTANDSISFIISVMDNGVPMDLANVTSANLVSLCPDRQVIETAGVIGEDGKVSFALSTEETAVAGTVRATVQLHGADGRVSTISFTYEVAKDLLTLHTPTIRERTLIEVVLQDGPLRIQEAEAATLDANLAAANAEQVATENKTRFLSPVDTVALRNSTYPNPVHGDTVRVTSEAAAYRFQTGSGWVKTDQYNPTAIDNVTAQLAETATDLNRRGVDIKKYEHLKVAIVEGYDWSPAINKALSETETIFFSESAVPYYVTASHNISASKKLIGFKAVIQQITANKEIFTAPSASNLVIEGIVFKGKGTDYTKTSTNNARAINILDNTDTLYSNNITIRNCEFYDFSFAAIALRRVKGFKIYDNKIVGTAASKGNMVKNDNQQFGVWLDKYCHDGVVEKNDVSQTAQGIFCGLNTYNVKFNNNYTHDIVGQHGFYLSHGIALSVIDNTIENCGLDGIKLQQSQFSSEISDRISVSDNKIKNVGSHAIEVINVDAANTYKIYNITIANNQMVDIGTDGLNIQDVVVGKIYGNILNNTPIFIANPINSRYGLYLSNNEDLDVEMNTFKNTNQNGIHLDSTLINKKIRFKGNVIAENGQSQTANVNRGINLLGGDDITFDNNLVTDKNIKSLYTFFTDSVVNLKLKNNTFKDKDIRFSGTVMPVEFDNNKVDVSVIGYTGVAVKGRKSSVYHGTIANAPSVSTGYVSGDRYEYTNPIAGGYVGKILIGTSWKEYGQITV